MSQTPENPFVVGAEVLVEGRYGDMSRDRIAKVHKTGRFVLESNPSQQWRPDTDWNNEYRAYETGEGWTRAHAIPWGPKAAEMYAKYQMKARFVALRRLVDKISPNDVSREINEQLERVIIAAGIPLP